MTTEQVQAATERFRSQLAALRENRNISDEGRQRAVAAAWVGVQAELDRVQADQAASVERERKDLERRLLGPGPRPLGEQPAERVARDASYRDALARAEAADADGLRRLLALAERGGDSIQARAVLAVAFDRRDADVVNLYLEAHEAEDADMTRLWSISEASGTRDIITTAFLFAAPERPSELAGLTDGQVRDLAAAQAPAVFAR